MFYHMYLSIAKVYYLTYKAQSLGYNPEMILAGRRLNDSMGSFVAKKLVKAMLKKGVEILGARVLVLGLTFKENCPDLRNTKVVDITEELESYGIDVDIVDPRCNISDARSLYQKNVSSSVLADKAYDALIFAVGHDEFRNMQPEEWQRWLKTPNVVYDLKAVVPIESSDIRL